MVDIYRLMSFNLGFNVMGNEVTGSEAPMCDLCRQTYPKHQGWSDSSQKISQCTLNAVAQIGQYDLIGLQEVNHHYQQRFEDELRRIRAYRFITGYNGVVTVYDSYVMGEGQPLTVKDYYISSHSSRRGFQVIWFPKQELIFVNLHAPHEINLKQTIEIACRPIDEHIRKHKIKPRRVIVAGDFNDYSGRFAQASLDIFGHTLKLPVLSPPKTCCTDSNYLYPGDYIFDSSNSAKYFGLPPDYQRMFPPMSDHDPVVLV